MKLEKMRYSRLQLALLAILLKAKKDITLERLEGQVYRNCGKRKPNNSHQAIAALIRSTSDKISYVKGSIKRTTPLGRGNEAAYVLVDPESFVRQTVERALS